MDYFLILLRDELWELMCDVAAFHAICGMIYLHEFLIRVFGDMLVMTKLMRMKGPNGFLPCCSCKIHGVRHIEGGGRTYYVPLHRVDGSNYDLLNLLKHGLMHLIPENMVKNLLTLWTGDFKGLDTGNEDYRLSESTVRAIGKACAAAGDTTLAAFGAHVPNISTQLHYFMAESYTLWTTLYFKHFLELVEDCLKLTIDAEYVDNELWEIYYQYNPAWLSTCTLTIHALLHIPDNILNGDPMWWYWNYITEQFVGSLVCASKSHWHPYASFAHRIREITQNNVIKARYNLYGELDLSDQREDETHGVFFVGWPSVTTVYTVGIGYAPGIYDDEVLARDQVSGFSNARWKKLLTYKGAVAIWKAIYMSASSQATPQDTQLSPGAGTCHADITSNEDPSITTLLCCSTGFDPLADKNRGYYALKPQTSEEEAAYAKLVPEIEMHLKVHAWIAKELFLAEPQEVQAKIKEEAEEEHAELVVKHEDRVEGLPSLDEDKMEEYMCQTKLNNEGKLDIEALSLHAGVTSVTPAKLDFSRGDKKLYGEVMRAFSRFVWGAHKYRKGNVDVDAVVVATTIEPTAPIMPETMGTAVTRTTTAPVAIAPTSVIPDVPLTNTFGDEEVRAMISVGNVGFQYNEFDFLDELVAGVNAVAPGMLLPGLGLPAEELYGGRFVGLLSADLLLKLDEMTVNDAEMLEQENNKACTYYMLNDMGLGDAQKETLWGRVVAPPATCKSVNQKRKGPGKRARKELEDLEAQMQGEASDSGMEGEEEPMKEAPTQKPDCPTKMPCATKDKKKDIGAW
ncbi:hypothetical protein B0H14DRAFT_3537463 [Mycena olivaceomarginata]|nr:hypothetical protein B0H14DRAFT_3537463 [Mycena olivaceomarginata]